MNIGRDASCFRETQQVNRCSYKSRAGLLGQVKPKGKAAAGRSVGQL